MLSFLASLDVTCTDLHIKTLHLQSLHRFLFCYSVRYFVSHRTADLGLYFWNISFVRWTGTKLRPSVLREREHYQTFSLWFLYVRARASIIVYPGKMRVFKGWGRGGCGKNSEIPIVWAGKFLYRKKKDPLWKCLCRCLSLVQYSAKFEFCSFTVLLVVQDCHQLARLHFFVSLLLNVLSDFGNSRAALSGNTKETHVPGPCHILATTTCWEACCYCRDSMLRRHATGYQTYVCFLRVPGASCPTASVVWQRLQFVFLVVVKIISEVSSSLIG